MDRILERLKKRVVSDGYGDGFVHDVKRDIRAKDPEAEVINFVKKAQFCGFSFRTTPICCYLYNDERYLLLNQDYYDAMLTLGAEPLDMEQDCVIIQGAGMLAMSYGFLPFRPGITAMEIVDLCLGLESEDESEDRIPIPFMDNIVPLFMPFQVFRLDVNRFSIEFEEDISRIYAYCILDKPSFLSHETSSSFQDFLLLKSTRSLANSVINGMECYSLEYTFLQFYQCLEYLFKLSIAFELISEQTELDKKTLVTIATKYKFKVSEKDSLLQIIQKSDEAHISVFLDLIEYSPSADSENIFQTAAEKIYGLRCSIAHLRYYDQQESFSDEKLKAYVDGLIGIIRSVYDHVDTDIMDFNSFLSSWRPINFKSN